MTVSGLEFGGMDAGLRVWMARDVSRILLCGTAVVLVTRILQMQQVQRAGRNG